MKILHVSDLHARPAWFEWLTNESSKYDLVCLTGDILNLGDLDPEPDVQIATVLPYLQAIQSPLAVCSGNHDLLDNQGYHSAHWMTSLRRKNVWIDDDVFWFCDYRFRCLAWCDPVPQENIRVDFLLAHAPPYGARTSTEAGGVSHGCGELRDACLSGRGPLFALGGHVHHPLDYRSMLHHTITLNPGQGDHPACPSHIVIDLGRSTVTHHRVSVAGVKLSTFNFTA